MKNLSPEERRARRDRHEGLDGIVSRRRLGRRQHVRDVALAPGESSTTEHELRCTRRAPGAIVLMNLEERKRLALLGREREREGELMLEEREEEKSSKEKN